MLRYKTHGVAEPLIMMLHWLGGSAKTWTEVSEGLAARGMRCAALDLPGFGLAAESDAFAVEKTAESVIATIQAFRAGSDEPWLLAGHSMGGKIATIVARAALDGRAGLENLRGLVMVSPSPPDAEPMSESTRRSMLDSLGHSTLDAAKDREHAQKFVDNNVGKMPIDDAVYGRTVDDVLRMNRAALVAWLTTGSKEGWASRVGTLTLPGLILAGTEESVLGPDAQREHMLPHLPRATVVPLVGCGHLAILERPGEVVLRIEEFVRELGLELAMPAMDADFQALIESNRTSPRTRDVLLRRLKADGVGSAGVLSKEEFLTLRAVAACMLSGCPFDLASLMDRWLGFPRHDGWRHDSLPGDVEAWRTGLRSLEMASMRKYGVPFVALNGTRQMEMLVAARDGALGRSMLDMLHLGDDLFTAEQMRDWFGDMHAELTKAYVADPRTMQRIGFTGFADEMGFTQIQLKQREEFER